MQVDVSIVGYLLTVGAIVYGAGKIRGDVGARMRSMEARVHNLEQAIVQRGLSVRGVRPVPSRDDERDGGE